MNILPLTLGSSSISAPWIDRGFSKDAYILRDLTTTAIERPVSIALGEPRLAAQTALDEAFVQAQAYDWDGLGSAAVEPSTYAYANEFLRLLHSITPVPDIWIDRDGEICFEWDKGPRQVFSVCIGRDGTLTYAGLFGYKKSHGTEHLGEALPLVVSANLERATSSSPA